MATHEFCSYSPNVLTYYGSKRSFLLDPNYDPDNDRCRIVVEDNDGHFDGDRNRNELGDDEDQIGTVSDGAGNQIASGAIYVEQAAIVRAPDGTEILLHRIEVEGQNVGYVPSEPLTPGVEYNYLGQYNVAEEIGGADTRESFSFYEQSSVPCFGPGTMIITQDGEIPVEWLDTSHKVLTRDHGFQPVKWVGRTKIYGNYFDRHPEERPIKIAAGSLGENIPARDLRLTGNHRVLIRSADAQLMFFSAEVFAPTKAWVDAGMATLDLPRETFTLTHVLCASHEVILAESVWVESMFTGAEALRRLSKSDVQQLQEALGNGFCHRTAARPSLSRREAAILLSDQELLDQNLSARIA